MASMTSIFPTPAKDIPIHPSHPVHADSREGREMPEFGLLSWIPLWTYFLHGLGTKKGPL
jgi:hypothetical protein